jgi:hypothetical protein
MDSSRFDALARSFSRSGSRRNVTRLLGGLALGPLAGALSLHGASAALLLGGERCTSKTECKSGRCLNPDKCDCRKKTCRCTCSCSRIDPKVRCKQPSNPCKKAVCSERGVCLIKPKCPSDGNPCTRDVCDNGVCSHPPDTTKNGTFCNNTGRICFDGVCCRRNCTGKTCGASDGCGGTCTCSDLCTCPNGEACVGETCGACPADTCSDPTACGATSSDAPCFCLTSVDDQVMCVSSSPNDMSCMAEGCTDDECSKLFEKPAICVDFTGCPLGQTCATRCLVKCTEV